MVPDETTEVTTEETTTEEVTLGEQAGETVAVEVTPE